MSTPAEQEAQRLLNFLAAMPQGNCTASSRSVVRAAMLATGGRMMACGYYHDVKSKHLGGGVYRLTLERIR